MRPIGQQPHLWDRLVNAAHAAAARPGEPDDEDARAFCDLYGPVACPDAMPFVIGQLGQSLDGRIATPTGHSHYINGPEAIGHLHRLRALVDAVVVGVGTAIADDPRLTVRQVPGPSPARVVIDPRGRLPATAALLADDGCRRLVVRADGCAVSDRPPGDVEPVIVPARGGRIDPHAVVAALAGRGLRRLLIEGGANTVSAFLAAGALDRLHVAVAPLLIGSGPAGLCLPPIDRLDAACRPRTAVFTLGDDVLFDCALRADDHPPRPDA